MGWVSQAVQKVAAPIEEIIAPVVQPVAQIAAPITNTISEVLGTSGSGSKTLGINTDDLSKTLTTDSSTSGLGALGKELTNNELVNAAAVTAAAALGGPLGAAAANGLISRAQGNDWDQVANNAAGAGLLAYAAPLAYDAISGALPTAATNALPTAEVTAASQLTPAAIEALSGTAGYGTNAAAVDAAINAGVNPAIVGSGAYNAAAQFGGSGSLYDAVASPLASGADVPRLTPAALESLIGTPGYGVNASAVEAAKTLGMDPALVGAGAYAPALGGAVNALATSSTLSDVAKLLGGSSQGNLSQVAIDILTNRDAGKNPGGMLDAATLYTGKVQPDASILKSLPQLAFGHGPTVAALSNGNAAPQGYKRGGLAYHQPEFITGATGHYVKGKGDGQSDDIPAMLADGEYVFDADTVAALGNGSSDAGAKRLDEMRQAIRKHKRSAPVDKIPPKAKSPLEYLKG